MLRFSFILILSGLLMLISSCENNADEECRSQVIGCWEVDSLYFRSDIALKYQNQLKDLQEKVKATSCFEFMANGRCRLLLESELLEGKWSIQDLELRLNLENGSANYFRLVDVDSQELVVEFIITVEEGVDLPIIQKMRPSKKKFDTMLKGPEKQACAEDPWASTLANLTPLNWVYFDFSVAKTCSEHQHKPLLHCYLASKGRASTKVIYQVLALPRLQKFMRKKLIVAIHFIDMPDDLPGAAEQLQEQADSLTSWSSPKLPFFVIRDFETNEILDSISNPRDDLELKRFLIETLAAFEK